jgi:hypothetical protein
MLTLEDIGYLVGGGFLTGWLMWSFGYVNGSAQKMLDVAASD